MAPMVPPTGEAAGVNERELCDTLTRDSRATVEDVQGGVALVLRPQQGGDMDTVREHARKMESAMTSAGQQQGGPTGAETCPLFDLARQGAKTSMSDTPRGVRLMITTQDPTQVKALRKQVRDFVKPAAQKKGQGGGPRQQPGEKGQQGGEKGQQPGEKEKGGTQQP